MIRRKRRPFRRRSGCRNMLDDMYFCASENIPEIIPEPDHITLYIDGKEIVLTYGQLAYIHYSSSYIYGER